RWRRRLERHGVLLVSVPMVALRMKASPTSPGCICETRALAQVVSSGARSARADTCQGHDHQRGIGPKTLGAAENVAHQLRGLARCLADLDAGRLARFL